MPDEEGSEGQPAESSKGDDPAYGGFGELCVAGVMQHVDCPAHKTRPKLTEGSAQRRHSMGLIPREEAGEEGVVEAR